MIRNFIGGEWAPARSGETFSTINPANGELIDEVARSSAADVRCGEADGLGSLQRMEGHLRGLQRQTPARTD